MFGTFSKNVKKEATVDLTFDEELHDDDDFMETLDQLDGPSIKKVRSRLELLVFLYRK